MTIIGSLHGIIRPPRTERGTCSKVSDPDVFFSDEFEDIREAKLMCASCPIRTHCLNNALQKSRLPGTWGGLTETERRSVREGRRTLTSSRDCAHCARPFMPRREDGKFCTRYCLKQNQRVSQTSPGTANPGDKLETRTKQLAKAG
ncbi:WhiB family transcriptional regulator [Mycolicibacterium septicum]|uniref:WhiB family transcriptional regulator n=1 Tax=Mycolicibacterium septicum TaxID=98668 RepID=UPI001AF15E39|nr:WhiB family transcriptional regulator [Mycolicibacterium septicum]